MKSLLGVAVICLLVCLTWAFERTVFVYCRPDTIRVIVNKYLFNDGVFVKPEELMLGNGCPVNNERWESYMLQYPVAFCGIQTEVNEKYLVHKTFLYYYPINRPYHHPPSEFHLSCTLPRLSLRKPSLVPGEQPQENNEINVMRIQPGTSYRSPEL